jgi:hypothetical protein
MPEIELTVEQQFKMRQIEDALKTADKDDIIIIFLALQRQCFVLGNNLSNLVKQWPTHPLITPEDPSSRGTSSETNN